MDRLIELKFAALTERSFGFLQGPHSSRCHHPVGRSEKMLIELSIHPRRSFSRLEHQARQNLWAQTSGLDTRDLSETTIFRWKAKISGLQMSLCCFDVQVGTSCRGSGHLIQRGAPTLIVNIFSIGNQDAES